LQVPRCRSVIATAIAESGLCGSGLSPHGEVDYRSCDRGDSCQHHRSRSCCQRLHNHRQNHRHRFRPSDPSLRTRCASCWRTESVHSAGRSATRKARQLHETPYARTSRGIGASSISRSERRPGGEPGTRWRHASPALCLRLRG
jgi:hypothetical protein